MPGSDHRAAAPRRTLVIGCGALARELQAVLAASGLGHVTVDCLPAALHNRPERIAPAVAARLAAARDDYDQVFVAYADCGTRGDLDAVLAEAGVERLPGAHCYEFYAGAERFAALHDEEPGTLYLTDYLARHFERLIISGLGIDRHPELEEAYFGNYRRLVYLSQRDDPDLAARAEAAAARLGLTYSRVRTGYGDLATSLLGAVGT